MQLLQRRIWQVREILRLIDQHLRLILQRRDLVIDLLQRASGRQHVLRIVVRIEHDDLRQRWRCCEADRERDGARRREATDSVHDYFSLGRKIGDDVGGPADATVLQPGGDKTVAAMFGENLCDRGLVRL